MYQNRKDAGIQLSKSVKKIQDEGKYADPVVLAIPKGGVCTGAEIAKALCVPMDIILVKKIPAPNNEELAIGSVSENGIVFLNNDLVEMSGVDEAYLREKGMEKVYEMEQIRNAYGYEPVLLEGKDVILVDDGVATGASMYLAAQSIAREMPRTITIALPVAPNDKKVLNMLKSVCHHLEILQTPENFMSVSKWYDDFHQLNDDEVKEILKSVKG
jgi:predicted phosphoribosyltransferase